MATSLITQFRPHHWRECRAMAMDFDSLGLIAPARYIRWMEETEYSFLRRIGLSVSLQDERGQLGFPRLQTRLEIFTEPALDEAFQVGVRLSSIDAKSISYDFVLAKVVALELPWSPSNNELLGTGNFRVACARFPRDRAPYAVLIPEWIEEKFRLGIVA